MTRLEEIHALCCRYNSSAVNVGAHALASKIISIIEREPSPIDSDRRALHAGYREQVDERMSQNQ